MMELRIWSERKIQVKTYQSLNQPDGDDWIVVMVIQMSCVL
jgi:hypothetical protein